MSTILLLAATLFITQNYAAKILAVFPTPSISHQVVFRPLTQELAKRGHEIIIITTDPAFPEGKSPPNLTEIDVHDISYQTWEELYKITSKGDGDLIAFIKPVFLVINNIIEIQLKTPEVQKLIKEVKFDLLLLEACAKPVLALSHHFNAPVIQISSFGYLEYNVKTIGASWHPLLFPNTLSDKIYNLTKWEKVVALWNYYRLDNIMNSVEEAENAMITRIFGDNFPTIDQLKNNVDMMLLNIHPIWADNRPVPPNAKYVWGIHERQVKELPEVCYVY